MALELRGWHKAVLTNQLKDRTELAHCVHFEAERIELRHGQSLPCSGHMLTRTTSSQVSGTGHSVLLLWLRTLDAPWQPSPVSDTTVLGMEHI